MRILQIAAMLVILILVMSPLLAFIFLPLIVFGKSAPIISMMWSILALLAFFAYGINSRMADRVLFFLDGVAQRILPEDLL